MPVPLILYVHNNKAECTKNVFAYGRPILIDSTWEFSLHLLPSLDNLSLKCEITTECVNSEGQLLPLLPPLPCPLYGSPGHSNALPYKTFQLNYNVMINRKRSNC